MSLQKNAGGSPSPIPPPKGGIIVSASKKRQTTGLAGDRLGLKKKPLRPGPQRENPRPSAQPKIPFASQAGMGVVESHPGQFSTRKPHHRGFFRRFRSRRQGRDRVIAFVLLPLAVLATALFVVWLLRSG